MATNLRDIEATDPLRAGRTPIADAMDPQSALRRSEERYRCLVQATSSIVWTSDPEGRFIMPQLGWAAYTGQTYDEYKNHGWWMAFHPEDRPGAPAYWLGGPAAKGEPHDVEARLWHAATDTHRYIRCRAVPIKNPDGKIREWIGTMADIHDAKMSVEKNRALETRYRAIFDQSPVSIQIFRPDGLCVHANDMHIKTKYYNCEERFEITGSRGIIWITRCTGQLLERAPLILYRDGETREVTVMFADLSGFTALSTTVPPGLSLPSRSAREITASAIRSLTLPVGFSHSSLARIAAEAVGTTLRRRTSDVLPMASRMLKGIAAFLRGSRVVSRAVI